jgi:uncharacterized protein YndB with AHSA1/START domain
VSTSLQETAEVPVRKSILVRAGVAHAFRVFTDGVDSWWPRTHHIGTSPMRRAVIQPRQGGRCYAEQEDGTECDWGTVLVWEPPTRLVMAWQVTPAWGYQPDLARSSEVEIRFAAEGEGVTRVELEHRHLTRHGPGAGAMRATVDSPNGWSGLLQLFAECAARGAEAGDAA